MTKKIDLGEGKVLLLDARLGEKQLAEYERVNNAYGEEVDRRIEAREKKQREALAYWNKHGPWSF